jgi:hypothetical protein
VDAGEEPEPEPEVNTTETLPASTTDNSTGANKEESDARIKQIQVKQLRCNQLCRSRKLNPLIPPFSHSGNLYCIQKISMTCPTSTKDYCCSDIIAKCSIIHSVRYIRDYKLKALPAS